jgi:hypothetical protein
MKTLVALVLATALLYGRGGLAADDPGAPGVWQERSMDFNYLGFSSHYSCVGLADKLQALLIAAGARSDASATPFGCINLSSPDKFPRARLKFAFLAPSTDNSSANTVPGTWRRVVLGYNKPYGLDVGDCELVEQFTTQVLPKSSVRNVVPSKNCIPYQADVGSANLTFDVFAPIKSTGKPAAK